MPVRDKYYQENARFYERDRFANQAGRWVDRRQKEILRELLPDLHGKRVLELGAGTGRISAILCEMGAILVAADEAPAMLEIAKSRLASYIVEDRCALRCESIRVLKNSPERFDYVVMVNVLGRLDKPEESIELASKALSPEGVLVFNYPNLASVYLLTGLFVNFRQRAVGRNTFSTWYLPKEINRMLRQHGFAITQKRGHMYVPMPRYLFPLLPCIAGLDYLLARPGLDSFYPSIFARAKWQ